MIKIQLALVSLPIRSIKGNNCEGETQTVLCKLLSYRRSPVLLITIISSAFCRSMVICAKSSISIEPNKEQAWFVQLLVSLTVLTPATPPRFIYPWEVVDPLAAPLPDVGRIHLARHHTQVRLLADVLAPVIRLLMRRGFDSQDQIKDVHWSKHSLCNAFPHSSHQVSLFLSAPCMDS